MGCSTLESSRISILELYSKNVFVIIVVIVCNLPSSFSFCILSIIPVAVLSDTEHFALAIDAILADALPTISTTRIMIVGFTTSSYFGRLVPPMLLIRFGTGLGFTAINIAVLTRRIGREFDTIWVEK